MKPSSHLDKLSLFLSFREEYMNERVVYSRLRTEGSGEESITLTCYVSRINGNYQIDNCFIGPAMLTYVVQGKGG